MKSVELGEYTSKNEVVEGVDMWRKNLGLEVEEINAEKPWGAYWKIKKESLGLFLELFFPEMIGSDTQMDLSPKFLLVAPKEKLSWQYHDRRAEEWKVVIGEVRVKLSETDEEPEDGKLYTEGDVIDLKREVRHRLIGEDGWGLVAEVWVHTDPDSPSDEEDIVRLADDYGRERR
ncbi:MAG TPA: phosphoheptose isomerase [Candidatus Woesebacteria bacterium]|nr:phosphoheptose isomerase [Candidatus Woesebacteria bacterium]